MSPPTPILLLKTKSTPHDGYEEYFSTNGYTPQFIPVLEHRFHTENLATVRQLFASGAFNTDTAPVINNGNGNGNGTGTQESNATSKKYGGMIFTSQRAVEAFAKMIEDNGLPFTPSISHPLPLYTVGPATARALTTLRDKYLPTATIHGAEAGNGQNLAYLMLDHYNALYPASESESESESATHPKPSLLFLVGEQRRDVIPKTLMDVSRGSQAIDVEEVVVYETGEMDSFEGDFRGILRRERERVRQQREGDGPGLGPELLWVVVFSPTGCEGMLRVLGLGPFADCDPRREETRGGGGGGRRDVFVATIGPTTRDFLRDRFGFEADVCAERPSAEGIAEGIGRFLEPLGR